jgi:AcrR family transcriptional regulator
MSAATDRSQFRPRRMKPTPRPAPPGPSTRERILDAAELCFADRGYAGTAMRDIAAAVELNPASLYNHFTSKKALYEAVLERGFRPILELIDSLARTDWTPEGIDRETDLLLARIGERAHLPRLLLHETLTGGEHLKRVARNWLRPLHDQALTTFKPGGDLRAWQEDELPLLLMAFHHLIMGHFALAPMLEQILEEDPLSPEATERHGRFMRKLVRLMVFEDVPQAGRPGDHACHGERLAAAG